MAVAAAQYSFLHSKIRGLKSKMLSAGDYEKLVQTRDIEEVIRVLSTTSYEMVFTDVIPTKFSTDDVDKALTKEFVSSYNALAKHVPRGAKSLVDAFNRRFYYNGLKSILKVFQTETETKEAEKFLIVPLEAEYKELVSLLDSEGMQQLIARVKDDKAREVLTTTLSDVDQLKETASLERALDTLYYTTLWKTIQDAGGQDKEAARKLIGTQIDVLNITITMRCKIMGIGESTLRKWLIPVSYRLGVNLDRCIRATSAEEILNILFDTQYRELSQRAQERFDKKRSAAEFEAVAEEYLASVALSLWLGTPFHLGILLSFFHLRWTELRNLRVIIEGKLKSINQEAIRQNLVIF